MGGSVFDISRIVKGGWKLIGETGSCNVCGEETMHPILQHCGCCSALVFSIEHPSVSHSNCWNMSSDLKNIVNCIDRKLQYYPENQQLKVVQILSNITKELMDRGVLD